MKNILSVKNLTIEYEKDDKKNKVLNNISFDLLEKEIISFVGESGSGKSTIANSIMQLLDSNAKIFGNIIFEEEDLLLKSQKEMQKIRGKKISIIFQDPFSSLNPTMKIGKQILEAISDNPTKEKVYYLFNLVGIKDHILRYNQYPHEISGGTRQRVMIAIAIASNPKIIIADEPTTSLDSFYQKQIIDLLKQINEKLSTSIIFISHDLSLVSNMSTKIHIMYMGEILESGNTNVILKNPKHPYTKLLINSIPKLEDEKLNIQEEIPSKFVILDNKICKFFQRCPFRKEICEKSYPEICNFNEEKVLCHLYKKTFKKSKVDLEKWMKSSSKLKI